jgi:4a-hydroxytetrahydrobiopterin dehydratase
MDWKEENNQLVKTFELSNFSSIINRLEVLAKVADKMNHHPDFTVYGYNKVRFELNTHDTGGVTELDYELAEKIDNIFA